MSREAQFMERFLKKRRTSVQDENVGPSHEHNQNDGSVPPPSDGQIDASPHEQTDVPAPPSPHGQNDASTHEPSSANTTRNSSQVEEINWEEEIQFDPGKRRSIDEYHPNQRDMVRRKYLANGPCQPRTADFEVTEICGKDRRVLLKQGLPFRGHDESDGSLNKGNFKELHAYTTEQNPEVRKVVAHNAPGNNQLTSSKIQKDIVECFAKEILHSVLREIGNDVFSLLVDESRDVAGKEQMAVVLRYVGKCGSAIETLVGLTHVKETTSKYLKSAIDDLFAEYKLSFKQVRGQGYDGASNMRVVKVLEYVEEEDRDGTNRRQLMSTILIITNTLSLALQRKNQDIVNAINCVNSTKASLNDLRRNGWESVLHEAYVFCDKHDISKLEMEDQYVNPKKPRQKTGITNRHHYEVDCFNDVIDWLLQELDNRFNEKNSELLVCSAALSPNESFHDFNLEHLMSLAKLYPKDFDDGELRDLRHHLHLYIADVRADDRFSGLSNICELSQKMVETRKHIVYPLVYRLLKLALVLPIATTTVERYFSAMRIVKTYLRNRLGDDALKYDLICYVEKSEMRKVTNDAVIDRFEAMKKRRKPFESASIT
nr:uncharacterized protein LOC109783366 [Aegilops tauschii subsp. strangulata]